jgi:hypothetical protein
MVQKTHVRVNIYLDDPGLKREIKMAAADLGVSLSSFCVEAIRDKLRRSASEASARQEMELQKAAAAMDRLRSEIGPVGISVRELLDEGRSR